MSTRFLCVGTGDVAWVTLNQCVVWLNGFSIDGFFMAVFFSSKALFLTHAGLYFDICSIRTSSDFGGMNACDQLIYSVQKGDSLNNNNS